MGYFRAEPHEYVVHYVSGRVRREGQGLSFWYWRLNSSVALVPMSVRDVPFAFQEVTADYQSVTFQGQISFRIADPAAALKGLNLAVHPSSKRPQSQDLELLSQRLGNAVISASAAELQGLDLRSCLRNFEEIASAVAARVKADATVVNYGLEIVSLVVTSVRPNPEVGKALEAEFREGLLRQADEAIYARRAAAIQEERKIKERELETDLALEARRKELISLESENQLAEAEAKGQALVAEGRYRLEQLRAESDIWKGVDPAVLVAEGLRKLGEKGADQVTITTEVLAALLGKRDG